MQQGRFRAVAIVAVVALAVGASAFVALNRTFSASGPRASALSFDPSVVDLGEIALGDSKSATVRIRNTGPSPRTITIAAASCGCTVPTWPTEPIPGGSSAEATVTMKPTGKVGERVDKTVTYVIDGVDRETISVRCVIVAPPPAGAPGPESSPPAPPAAPAGPVAGAVPASPAPAAPEAAAPAAPAPTVGAVARTRPPFRRVEPSVFPSARVPFPALEAWLKGTPRRGFEPGKVFVFDFFATNCSHCREYAPLVTRLAREYGAKGLEFVAITDEPEDRVRAWLSQPGKLEEVPYSVAVDADRSSLSSLQAGTFRSFNPRFFVMRDGMLLWHGHPKEAEPVLAAIAAGTWDPASVKDQFILESIVSRAKNYLDAVAKDCDASGDWTPMFAALDSVRAAVPERSGQYDAQRFVIMIGLAGLTDEGYAFGREAAKRHAADMQTQRSLARAVLQSPYVKRRDLDLGLELALAADALAKGEDARAADTVALAWFSKGDRAKAIEHGERAVRIERDPKMRAQYEAALVKYRTAPMGPEPTRTRTPAGQQAPAAGDAPPPGD